MKVSYYISTIPEVFRKQAAKNCVKQGNDPNQKMSEETTNLWSAINILFDPSKSDEGEEYWKAVSDLKFPIFAR